jgi:subtilase family serine protease
MSSIETFKLYPHYKINYNIDLTENITRSTRPWFWANEVANIYKIPTPTDNNVNIAVVSFGGGLYGSLDALGNLTNSDVEKYWLSLGISPSNIPKVIVKPINGAINKPNDKDNGATIENTIDVETIGACCPTSKLTIILYIAPNNLIQFPKLINYILNDTIKIDVISISWGAPEIYFGSSLLNSINNLFSTAVNRGINITAASGDYGSNNGVGGNGSYCDYPSSSPNVTAVGGTKLICPNYEYNNNTFESAWSNGGGAISHHFKKPNYQNKLNGTKRSTPDIALIADPNTGIRYLINDKLLVIGGTSIASPIFASFLAAINSKIFINPIIYSSGAICFNDIKSGSNGSFKAKINYDNCTGFGSIKGNILNNICNASLSTNNYQLTVFNKTKTQLLVNSNLDLSLIKYSSNNPKIISVNNSGLITAKKLGNTKINITTPNFYVKTIVNINVAINPNTKINKPSKKKPINKNFTYKKNKSININLLLLLNSKKR